MTKRETCRACVDALEVGDDDLCFSCRETLESRQFADWLGALRLEMVKDGETPATAEKYGGPKDWLRYFLEDATPREALNDDYSYA